MKLLLDEEFKSICKEIIEDNKSEQAWCENGFSDQFQSEHYCGGFDESVNAFIFGYYADDGSLYSFLLSLQEISNVLSGKLTDVEALFEEIYDDGEDEDPNAS